MNSIKNVRLTLVIACLHKLYKPKVRKKTFGCSGDDWNMMAWVPNWDAYLSLSFQKTVGWKLCVGKRQMLVCTLILGSWLSDVKGRVLCYLLFLFLFHISGLEYSVGRKKKRKLNKKLGMMCPITWKWTTNKNHLPKIYSNKWTFRTSKLGLFPRNMVGERKIGL